MPRKRNLEFQLVSINCKEYKQFISSISINRFATYRFHNKATCFIWYNFQTKFLNKESIKLVLKQISESEDGLTFNNNVIKWGKAIHLLGFSLLVVAGISALTYVAGTTASVVLANKQANKDKRHHCELEAGSKKWYFK